MSSMRCQHAASPLAFYRLAHKELHEQLIKWLLRTRTKFSGIVPCIVLAELNPREWRTTNILLASSACHERICVWA
jgi:hypothetical protein